MLSRSAKVRYYDYDNARRGSVPPCAITASGKRSAASRCRTPAPSRTSAPTWLTREASWSLAFNRQSWDRDYREIEESDEDVLKLTYDTRFGDFQLRAFYEMGDRSIGEYSTEAQEWSFIHPEGINNLPALRKYDEAAREYDGYGVQGWWYATRRWTCRSE
jgi:hypothetical protein